MRRLLLGVRPGMTEHEAFSAVPADRAAVLLPPDGAVRRAGRARAGQLVRAAAAPRRPDERRPSGTGAATSPAAASWPARPRTCPPGRATTSPSWSRPTSPAPATGTRRSASASPAASCSTWSRRHLGDPFFGVHLNPGHFIHLDEWPSSPVFAGSDVVLRLGDDAAAGHHPGHRHRLPHHEHRGRRGAGRRGGPRRARGPLPGGVGRGSAAAASSWPASSASSLRPEVLPLSNLAGYLPPYWLAPGLAMRRA